MDRQLLRLFQGQQRLIQVGGGDDELWGTL